MPRKARYTSHQCLLSITLSYRQLRNVSVGSGVHCRTGGLKSAVRAFLPGRQRLVPWKIEIFQDTAWQSRCSSSSSWLDLSVGSVSGRTSEALMPAFGDPGRRLRQLSCKTWARKLLSVVASTTRISRFSGTVSRSVSSSIVFREVAQVHEDRFGAVDEPV